MQNERVARSNRRRTARFLAVLAIVVGWAVVIALGGLAFLGAMADGLAGMDARNHGPDHDRSWLHGGVLGGVVLIAAGVLGRSAIRRARQADTDSVPAFVVMPVAIARQPAAQGVSAKQ